MGAEALRYAPPNGVLRLREQLARRSIDWGCAVPPDHFVVTNGASEALSLALQAVTRPGDVVAVESPAYYGILQVLEALGLRALEVPADAGAGLRLECLRTVIDRHDVRAVVAVTNVSNPLGATMSDERKRELVELLAASRIALIEDDVWGDLSFGLVRPRAAKAYDRRDRVLLCGSFRRPWLRVCASGGSRPAGFATGSSD
jgi:DNA-binding transcriptional MocR family regulator